ncbi:MAG: hypothetical protein NZO16_03095, partial [Deltaproteobacteria bacterium]|nr:hypothetical protein [Deltaproteobacteria bacterium]
MQTHIARFLLVTTATFALTFIFFSSVWFPAIRVQPALVDFIKHERIVAARLTRMPASFPFYGYPYHLTSVKFKNITHEFSSNNDFIIPIKALTELRQIKVKIQPNYSWYFIFCLLFGLLAICLQPLICAFLYGILLLWIFFYFRMGNAYAPLQALTILFLISLSYKIINILTVDTDQTFKGSNKTIFCILVFTAILGLIGVYERYRLLQRPNKLIIHSDEIKKFRGVERLIRNNLSPNFFARPRKLKHPPLMIRVFAKVITFSQNWRDEFILKLRKTQFVLGLIILLIVSGISLLVSGTAGMTVSFGVFSLGILPSLTGFYIKEDNLLGLLTSMFAICGIFYIQTKKPVWCLLASIFAVLSASAKYPGFLNVVLIVSIILIVYPSLGGQRKKHIVFILLGLAFGFGILLLFLPELMLFHDKVTDGLEYEVRRGLLSHFGFKIPAIDFFGLFLFWKTFFEYENIFFGSIAVISLQFAIKQIKDKKILFLLIGFLIYY